MPQELLQIKTQRGEVAVNAFEHGLQISTVHDPASQPYAGDMTHAILSEGEVRQLRDTLDEWLLSL